jgi:hypothetical protein
MAETLNRPTRPSSSRATSAAPAPRRPIQAGATGALWAVCAGLVATALPVLLVWATDGRSGSGAAAALRTAGQVWLFAHGAALEVPGGLLGLSPVGLLALPLVLLLRAGGHSARVCRVKRLSEVPVLALALAAPYAVLAAIVAALSETSAVRAAPWQALLSGFVVAGLGAVAGILRATGLWRAVMPALPGRAARLTVAATGALAVLLAGGALAAGGAFVAHLGRAGDLQSASAPGLVGGVALLLLGLLLVPNAAVWGAAWLAGPGFHVGVGTAVGPFGTTLGPVPALPLLAGLPGPISPWLGALALAVPLAAGAFAGLLVVRRLAEPSWRRAAAEAALAGPCAGLVAGLAGWLAGGPAGGARLTDVGPSPWLFGLVVAVEVAAGAAACAALVVRRRLSS